MSRCGLAGAVAFALVLSPATASAKRPILQLSHEGAAVTPGTEIGFIGSIVASGHQGEALLGGGGPLQSNDAHSDRFSSFAGAGGGFRWKLEGHVSQVSFGTDGMAVVRAKKLEVYPEPGGGGTGPAEPPIPVIPAVSAKATSQCWYLLPSKMTGSFPVPGQAIVTISAPATPNSACTQPGFEVTLTLTFQSESAGRPTLETSLIS
jgi:hypothetical protein